MPRRKASEKTNNIGEANSSASASQSKLSMILGALIILVIGILVFNYFNKQKSDLGPSQKTEITREEDVSPNGLPGKYTVKDGDTLFLIAEKYYGDGEKFEELAKSNNLENPDSIEAGQILDIPKLDLSLSRASEASSETSPTPQASPEVTAIPTSRQPAGGVQQTPPAETTWGPVITQDTYTVAEGDWLSKIAGRAYGDIFAYGKIARANNIQDPDLIEPGMVLKIPR